MPKLSPFEGLEVTQSSIEIPGAAGGLRDALKVDPMEAHKGEVIHVVLECEVRSVRHDPVVRDDFTGAQARVHILAVTNATIVDKALVAEELAAQADRIAAAKELEGQQKLATTPPFLGYDELGAAGVLERIDAYDSSDEGTVDAIEAYEEAHQNRPEILKAIKEWRDA